VGTVLVFAKGAKKLYANILPQIKFGESLLPFGSGSFVCPLAV
jgi:hypothetical protein